MQLERASRLTVEFDGVSWALCHDRTPFIEMALTGISLTNLRNRDQSGESACWATSRPTFSCYIHAGPLSTADASFHRGVGGNGSPCFAKILMSHS